MCSDCNLGRRRVAGSVQARLSNLIKDRSPFAAEGVLGPWHAALAKRTRTQMGGAKAWATAALHRTVGGGAYTLISTDGGLRVMACACESGARVLVLEEEVAS